MNKLKMKARSGVTLVELLVVILIVTVLSVAMLPLLQPFVTEAQFAAEGIPAVGNIRTKIGVYVYDQSHLPYDPLDTTINQHTEVQAWTYATGKTDSYVPCTYAYGTQDTITWPTTGKDSAAAKAPTVWNLLDMDWQDFSGKRTKPLNFQYFVINKDTSSYVVGCFGYKEKGLKEGCGYAVCEINFPAAGRKLLGTWKRYKSYSPDNQVSLIFTKNKNPDATSGKVLSCYVPDYTAEKDMNKANQDAAIDGLKNAMIGCGWEFN